MGIKYTGNLFPLDTVNSQNQIYCRDAVEAAVAKFNNEIEANRAVGELDAGGILQRPYPSAIDFTKVSHRVTRLWIEDDILKAEIESLDTPNGKLLTELLETGLKPKLGVRAAGDFSSLRHSKTGLSYLGKLSIFAVDIGGVETNLENPTIDWKKVEEADEIFNYLGSEANPNEYEDAVRAYKILRSSIPEEIPGEGHHQYWKKMSAEYKDPYPPLNLKK